MALYKEIGIDSEEKILIFNAVKFAILEGVDIFVKPKYGAIASFNPYTLQCLGIYDSTRVAMEDTGIHMSSINRAARKGALSGGMLWMYVRDMKERESDKSLREFYI